ncbi:MAG: lecithin retinol acyltransferase family protein [Planctomycetota bacterium]
MNRARRSPSASSPSGAPRPGARADDPFLPGDPIAVDVFPGRVVTHVGVVSSVGPDGVRVISASARRGGVYDESLEDFAQGGAVYRPAIPRFVARDEVLARARGHLGRRYRLFSGNCEHLVYEVLGHPRRSPQLSTWLRGAAATAASVAAVAGAALAARARARRGA